MSTSSASSFATHGGSSPGSAPTARALPSGRGGGETPVHHRERFGGPADVALVVGVRVASRVEGVAEGVVVVVGDPVLHGDPHRDQALAVVVADAQDGGGIARVGPHELDLVDGRVDGLAVLGAQAGTVPARERLLLVTSAVHAGTGLAGRITRRRRGGRRTRRRVVLLHAGRGRGNPLAL